VRGLRFGGNGYSGWDRNVETGAGVERAFGRLLAGAEGLLTHQPGVDPLREWRIRGGWSF
jgi:hypothetical protein